MSRQLEWIRGDWVKRTAYLPVDFKRMLAHSIIKNAYTSVYAKEQLTASIHRMSLHFSRTEQRNRCRITGRAYFVLSKAGLARMPFRFIAGCGLLSGISRRGK